MSVDLAACLRLRRRLSLAAVRRAAETLDTTVSFTVKAVTSVHPLELTSFLPMNSELPSSWELNHQYICRLPVADVLDWQVANDAQALQLQFAVTNVEASRGTES